PIARFALLEGKLGPFLFSVVDQDTNDCGDRTAGPSLTHGPAGGVPDFAGWPRQPRGGGIRRAGPQRALQLFVRPCPVVRVDHGHGGIERRLGPRLEAEPGSIIASLPQFRKAWSAPS